MGGGDERINTTDLQGAVKWVMGEASDFAAVTTLYRGIVDMAGRESVVGKWFMGKMDYTGSGDVTNKDFRLMHGELDKYLDTKRRTIDARLPMWGQCVFGTVVGFGAARTVKMAWRHKFKVIAATAVSVQAIQLLRNTPAPTPEQEILRQRLETATNDTHIPEFSLADVKVPTTASERERVLDNVGLGIVNRKLGPGGIADGSVGMATLALGCWWGFRCL